MYILKKKLKGRPQFVESKVQSIDIYTHKQKIHKEVPRDEFDMVPTGSMAFSTKKGHSEVKRSYIFQTKNTQTE
jgi:hypothetical protein